MRNGAVGAVLFAYISRQNIVDQNCLTMSRGRLQSTKPASACDVSDCLCHDHDDDTTDPPIGNKSKITGKEIVFVNELSGLTKIMDDDAQLVMWRQSASTRPKFLQVRLISYHFLCIIFHTPILYLVLT